MKASWDDVSAEAILRFLGERGCNFHPRDIFKPNVLAEQYGLPLSLLPVMEIVASDAPAGTVLLGDDRRRVAAMQGVVVGDLIDAIAKGLGVAMPGDAPCGYSGRRWALAEAIVRHVRGCSP